MRGEFGWALFCSSLVMMGAGLEGRLVVIERLTGFDDMGGILVAEGAKGFYEGC